MTAHRAPMVETCEGFSLVELMVTLVIGLVLMGGVIVIFIANQQANTQAEALSRVQENVRFASDFLIRDIRNAGFRDEASVTYLDFLRLGAEPALVQANGDFGDRLTVSYAGRGDCNEPLVPPGEPVLRVVNTYEVADLDNGGRGLLCNGDLLVSGIERLTASGLCPNGSTTCNCPEACVGILLTVVFEGQGGGNPSHSAQLKALFRNRILESHFQD